MSHRSCRGEEWSDGDAQENEAESKISDAQGPSVTSNEPLTGHTWSVLPKSDLDIAVGDSWSGGLTRQVPRYLERFGCSKLESGQPEDRASAVVIER